MSNFRTGRSEAQSPLIRGLMESSAYPHEADPVEMIETHISWVLLAGDYAYKIKKPVSLGFLDFSRLEKRHFYCDEELRINRRFAPDLYLDVVAITGSESRPQVAGQGDAIEYAVRMHRFDESARLDHRLDDGFLCADSMHRLGERIAAYHMSADHLPPDSDLGTAKVVTKIIRDNILQLESSMVNAGQKTERLDTVKRWIDTELTQASPLLEQRRQTWARECHGDLHLSNLVDIDGNMIAFDCIEFDPYVRCVDVVYDFAFLVMDLESRKRSDLAFVFLDSYLSVTGDYAGVQLLPLFLVHTTLVRAKVAATRLSQERENKESLEHLEFHLDLASRYIEQKKHSALVITCGFSGSGKSMWSDQLVAPLRAIRIRSDVERKRLAGLSPFSSTDSTPGRGLYSQEMNRRTYECMRGFASDILRTGLNVLVDAAFLSRMDRDAFRSVAAEYKADFHILWFTAPEKILEQRVTDREHEPGQVSEAGIDVLRRQIDLAELPDPDEENVFPADTSQPDSLDRLTRYLSAYMQNGTGGQSWQR